MNTLDGGFRCNMVSALEESIWLDRREHGCASPAAKAGLGRLLQRLRDLRIRMQLGPLDVSRDWSGGDPDKRF
jgi:hypothetical protein